MLARVQNSRLWNGPAAPFRSRLRLLAVGGVVLGLYGSLEALPGAAPSPVEWLASAGLVLILFALLPESATDPPRRVTEPASYATTWADWLQIAFNLLVAALFVTSIVLFTKDQRAAGAVLGVTVGLGLVCALVNHMRNEGPHPSD